MKKIIEFIKNLQFLFRPDYWLMQYEYSKEWDTLVNYFIENKEPIFDKVNSIDGKIYNVSFMDVTIWIQNYPYAYGTPSPTDSRYKGNKRYRPSRLTVMKLHKFIEPKKREIELRYCK
jgi:hypothetical protein